MTPFRIYIGYDPRVSVAYTVAASSLVRYSSVPLAITPLVLGTLPMERRGLTEFTYSRFLVPYLAGFDGPALFMDSDIIATSDIAKIADDMPDTNFAVACADTDPAFEQAAVMLFNCGHPDNKKLTPEYLDGTKDSLHLIPWTEPRKLANRWNFLVGYDDPAWMEGKTPDLVHYTKGIPIWPETVNCAYASLWHDAHKHAIGCATDYTAFMGSSVHVQQKD